MLTDFYALSSSVQLAEPMGFTGVTDWNRVRGNLEDKKWLNDSYIRKYYLNMCSSSWKLEICSTVPSLETTDKGTVSFDRCLSWCWFHVNSLAGLCLCLAISLIMFQAAGFVWKSSLKLSCLKVTFNNLYCLHTLEMGGS